MRDLLHVDDLCDLDRSSSSATPTGWDGATVNVGGGVAGSLSLRETTDLCRELTGNEVRDRAGGRGAAGRRAALRVGLPARCSSAPRGGPRATPRTMLEDTLAWIEANEQRRAWRRSA